jgi:hypothetical protein
MSHDTEDSNTVSSDCQAFGLITTPNGTFSSYNIRKSYIREQRDKQKYIRCLPFILLVLKAARRAILPFWQLWCWYASIVTYLWDSSVSYKASGFAIKYVYFSVYKATDSLVYGRANHLLICTKRQLQTHLFHFHLVRTSVRLKRLRCCRRDRFPRN